MKLEVMTKFVKVSNVDLTDRTTRQWHSSGNLHKTEKSRKKAEKVLCRFPDVCSRAIIFSEV
jgi:hypothetical protein